MKNFAKFAVFAVAVIALAVFTRPFLWFRIFGAEVARNGHRLPDARLFKSNSGALLIVLGPPAGRVYILQPENGSIGIPSSAFWLETAAVYATSQAPVQFVALGSPKTDSSDPKLMAGNRNAEFLDYDGVVVKVKW